MPALSFKLLDRHISKQTMWHLYRLPAISTFVNVRKSSSKEIRGWKLQSTDDPRMNNHLLPTTMESDLTWVVVPCAGVTWMEGNHMNLTGQPALDVKTPARGISAVSIQSPLWWCKKILHILILNDWMKSYRSLNVWLLLPIFTQTTFYFLAFCDLWDCHSSIISGPVENHKFEEAKTKRKKKKADTDFYKPLDKNLTNERKTVIPKNIMHIICSGGRQNKKSTTLSSVKGGISNVS